MKKILSLLVTALIAVGSVNAQPLAPSKITDNIELTVKSGVVSPVKGDWHIRSVSGVELRKNLTPITGLGIEGDWTINTSASKNVFDHQLVGAFMTTNLMNLFAGYPGTPRVFEIETVAGAGWIHEYRAHAEDLNSWYTKYGLNLNFNLDQRWQLSLKPSIVYDMKDGDRTRYNVKNAYFDAQLGVTYKFKTSNGTHNFAYSDYRYTQADMDALNAEINALRNREPEIREVYIEKIVTETAAVVSETPIPTIDNVIGFTINSARISPTEYANLANVAELIKNSGATVRIVGHADKDTGTPEYNAELAQKRADAVGRVLVEQFGVNPEQVEAIGSSAQPYSTNDWNRAVTFEVLR